MAEYGLLETGLRVKPTAVHYDEMAAALRGKWGDSFAVGLDDPIGQLLAIVAKAAGDIGELVEAVYAARHRHSATRASLDHALLLTGTERAAARESTVDLWLIGTNGTTIPAGSLARSASTGATFATDESAQIVTVASWASSTAYVIGDRRTNASRLYQVITAGTSAGSGGPTTTAADITDGTVHWRYIGEGTAAVEVAATCTVTGATAAVAGDVTVIGTAVSGWSTVDNLEDAVPGRAVATDAEARMQGDADLFRPGAGTPDAIREVLLNLDGVETASVLYNPTDTTDGDGIPPHAVECIVTGGDDQDILDALLTECVALGIATHSSGSGAVTGTATDAEGTEHDVEFSRAAEINFWLEFDVLRNPATFPSTGDAALKAALVAYGNTLETGYDVIPSAFIPTMFGVAGVVGVVTAEAGTSSSTGPGTWTLTKRQRAVFDTARVTINYTNHTP